MKQILLPHGFKKVGLVLLGLGVTLFLLATLGAVQQELFDWKVYSILHGETLDNNLLDEIVAILILTGGLFAGFSKERFEDDVLKGMRLNALLWSVYINYAILILAFLLVHEFHFLQLMMYNMFTILIVYILRFNYVLFINSRKARIYGE